MRTSLTLILFFILIIQLSASTPSNDFCQNAMSIPITHDIDELNIYNFEDATGTDPDAGALECYSYTGPNVLEDIWFKVVVPSTGKVLVLADGLIELGDDYIFMSDIQPTFEAYTGDCNNLQLITDSYNNCYWANTFFDDDFLGLYYEGTPNEEIYIRVFDFEFNISSYQFSLNEEFGVYAIEIHESDNTDCSSATNLNVTPSCNLENYRTSSTEPISWFSFTYPSNTNNVNAQILDKNFEFYNSNLPSSNISIYSGSCGALTLIQTFNSARSFSLSNIAAGQTIFIKVEFQWTETSESFFEFCILEKENDICSDAIDLPVGSTCQPMFYNNYGSTASNNPTGSLSCKNSVNDVWFKTTVPATGNVTIELLYSDLFFSFPEFEFYTGNCGALTSISCIVPQFGIGGFTPSAHHFTGLTPGEIIYTRVTNAYSYQGNQICAFDVIPLDDCLNASLIDLNEDCSTFPIFQFTGATISDPNLNFPCNFSLEEDLWFRFIVNSTNNISVYIDHLNNQFNFSPYIDIYKGICSNLTPVDNPTCKNGSSLSEAVILENLNVGDQIFVRVINCCLNALGSFNVCAEASCPDIIDVVTPLSTDEFTYKADVQVNGYELITNGARVTFQGVECVQLLPGFEVQINSYFEANLDGCNN